MFKCKLIFLTILLSAGILILTPKKVLAIEDPLASPNNPFGIHILNENDLEDAAALVNSQGGDWGYVTLVIRKDERDTKRWQRVFDKMRRLHLIPLVRIATREQDGGWEKPSFDEIDGWVSFLSSLNWMTKDQYVIIGNEPNHAKEWGDEINPGEYATYLKKLSTRLKEASEDFFILPAGLDASAPNNKLHMSEALFLKTMLKDNPDIFDYLDGWTSHSYPNPDFSGSETARGQGTIRTFDWELAQLKKLGVNKELPVFITETGWAHAVDGQTNGYEEVETIGDKFKAAYSTAWSDKRIVAVTPFVLNYQQPPFDIFSWKKTDGSFYPLYYEVQNIPKPAGKPVQITSGKIIAYLFPPILKIGEKTYGLLFAKNTGQTIWSVNETIEIGDENRLYKIKPILTELEPMKSAFLFFER